MTNNPAHTLPKPVLLTADTSSASFSICLVKDECFFEYNQLASVQQSAVLFTAIERICADAEISLSAVDAFGIISGPGSFTGLRSGMSAFKTLAYSGNKPLYVFNSLDMLSRNIHCPAGDLILSVIDARRNAFYAALYRLPLMPVPAADHQFPSMPVRIGPYLDIPNEKMRAAFQSNREFTSTFCDAGAVDEFIKKTITVHLSGDGSSPCALLAHDASKSIESHNDLIPEISPFHFYSSQLRAAVIAEALQETLHETLQPHKTKPADVLSAAPWYLRNSEAENNKRRTII